MTAVYRVPLYAHVSADSPEAAEQIAADAMDRLMDVTDEVVNAYVEDDADIEHVGVECSVCGGVADDDDPRAGHGMCGFCLHDATRSGWTPGKDD